MNKNIENYKKAIDNIQASDELINKTINKASEKTPSKRGNFILYTLASLSACVAILLVAINIIQLHPEGYDTPTSIVATVDNNKEDNSIEGYVKNFKSQEELDKKIDELNANYRQYFNRRKVFDDAFDSQMSSVAEDSSGLSNSAPSSTSSNYSKTNIQVEGVDEADIIKTDGTNIYLVKSDALYVLDKDLKLVDKKNFEKRHIYIEQVHVIHGQ